MRALLADAEWGWLGTLLGLLSIPLLVAFNAFFVAAEFALVAVRKTRVEELAAHKVKGAHAVSAALREPQSHDRRHATGCDAQQPGIGLGGGKHSCSNRGSMGCRPSRALGIRDAAFNRGRAGLRAGDLLSRRFGGIVSQDPRLASTGPHRAVGGSAPKHFHHPDAPVHHFDDGGRQFARPLVRLQSRR